MRRKYKRNNVSRNHFCRTEIVIADKGYDADERVRKPLAQRGIQSVIPSNKNRLSQIAYDKYLCKTRHLVENFFAKLKQYRCIATRYDKLYRNFLSGIYLAFAVIWLA
jgi:transposase